MSKIRVEIENMAFGGRGIARHKGRVLFVQGAFTGDEVDVEIVKEKKSHSFAKAIRNFTKLEEIEITKQIKFINTENSPYSNL